LSAAQSEGNQMEEQPAKPGPAPVSQPVPPEKPVAAPAPAPAPAPPMSRKRRRGAKIIAGVAILVLVAATVVFYVIRIAPYESTDDAFIEGRVTIISPRVSGQVIRLLVDDNQLVKQGELLLEIDPADYETKKAQAVADEATARAQLEQSKAQTTVDEARAEQQQAAVVAAEADANRAAADLKRYEAVESRAISKSQLDLAQAQARSTAANLDVARSQVKAANAQVALSRVNTDAAKAQVQQAAAKLEQAGLDVSYTRVVAPVNGRVTRRTVEQGIYIQTGQALLTLVPQEVWVVANFKEGQLAHMRTNQPVTISIDAYPGREFKGHIDSIQAGTGARFGLLPPENAVGNYVKVVQRVPVKILFDEPPDPQLDLAPGLSVVPKVKVK
jgi:membrane fusion protein, multidrug efflux system